MSNLHKELDNLIIKLQSMKNIFAFGYYIPSAGKFIINSMEPLTTFQERVLCSFFSKYCSSFQDTVKIDPKFYTKLNYNELRDELLSSYFDCGD